MAIKILLTHKRIAIVARDHKKQKFINRAVKNKAILARHELVATGTTGRMLKDALAIPVRQMLSGPHDSDAKVLLCLSVV